MSIAKTNKDQSIETLRGIAIILMVMGHIIGNVPHRGLRVPDDSIYRYIYYSLEYLRMPLFTAISGYVYAMRPVNLNLIPKFFKGKFRRILLPMVVVSSVHFLALKFIPGTNRDVEFSEMWRIYVFGFEHFWFLQSIFLVFVCIVILEKLNFLADFHRWLVCLLGAIAYSNLAPKWDFFSFYGFQFLLPYFLMGYAFNRHWDRLRGNKVLFSLGLIFIVSVAIHQLNWFQVIDFKVHQYSILATAIGICGNYLLFRFRPTINVLASLGSFAYGIYLFHVFPAAGTRIVLTKIGLDSKVVLFFVCLSAGLLLPILAEKIIMKFKFLRLPLLGLK